MHRVLCAPSADNFNLNGQLIHRGLHMRATNERVSYLAKGWTTGRPGGHDGWCLLFRYMGLSSGQISAAIMSRTLITPLHLEQKTPSNRFGKLCVAGDESTLESCSVPEASAAAVSAQLGWHLLSVHGSSTVGGIPRTVSPLFICLEHREHSIMSSALQRNRR